VQIFTPAVSAETRPHTAATRSRSHPASASACAASGRCPAGVKVPRVCPAATAGHEPAGQLSGRPAGPAAGDRPGPWCRRPRQKGWYLMGAAGSGPVSDWRVRGSYFEGCNCEAICPCRSVGGRPGGPSSFGGVLRRPVLVHPPRSRRRNRPVRPADGAVAPLPGPGAAEHPLGRRTLRRRGRRRRATARAGRYLPRPGLRNGRTAIRPGHRHGLVLSRPNTGSTVRARIF
jgi:hypothetical protein